MVLSVSTQPVYNSQDLLTQLLGINKGSCLQVINAVAEGLMSGLSSGLPRLSI